MIMDQHATASHGLDWTEETDGSTFARLGAYYLNVEADRLTGRWLWDVEEIVRPGASAPFESRARGSEETETAARWSALRKADRLTRMAADLQGAEEAEDRKGEPVGPRPWWKDDRHEI